MKKFIGIVLSLIAMVFTFAAPAWAADGAAIFTANCAACHAGGGNVVQGNKTLKMDDLKANLAGFSDGSKSLEEAIITQVTNGKGAMPAFARLGAEDIQAVAAYVASKAEAGW